MTDRNDEWNTMRNGWSMMPVKRHEKLKNPLNRPASEGHNKKRDKRFAECYGWTIPPPDAKLYRIWQDCPHCMAQGYIPVLIGKSVKVEDCPTCKAHFYALDEEVANVVAGMRNDYERWAEKDAWTRWFRLTPSQVHGWFSCNECGKAYQHGMRWARLKLHSEHHQFTKRRPS